MREGNFSLGRNAAQNIGLKKLTSHPCHTIYCYIIIPMPKTHGLEVNKLCKIYSVLCIM